MVIIHSHSKQLVERYQIKLRLANDVITVCFRNPYAPIFYQIWPVEWYQYVQPILSYYMMKMSVVTRLLLYFRWLPRGVSCACTRDIAFVDTFIILNGLLFPFTEINIIVPCTHTTRVLDGGFFRRKFITKKKFYSQLKLHRTNLYNWRFRQNYLLCLLNFFIHAAAARCIYSMIKC